MNGLFTEQGRQEIIDRIHNLTPQSVRQWGKMSVVQMMAHCQKPLEVVTGELIIKNDFKMKLLAALAGKTFKRKYLSGAPLQKGGPTVPSFIIKDEGNFETEKKLLLQKIDKATEAANKNSLIEIHPFFGKLTLDEWSKLQYIHLDHHLKQFSV